jgi:hypothetical protein
MKKTYPIRYIFFPIIAISLSILACAGRTFTLTKVYAIDTGKIAEYYDEETETIIGEDVWAFRSDGTFDAILIVEEEIMTLSGKYEGDDVGDMGFYIFLNTDIDGIFDDGEVLLDTENDEYKWIEWIHNGITYRYYLLAE